MRQTEALTILKTGVNVFLTGEPGSGKTHTINEYVKYLRESGIEPSITASTGIAATHVGGMTIHSWSGIGVRRDLTKYDLDQITQNKKVVERIVHAHVLIIDEVSMLSAAVLSMVDAVCREVRRSTLSFGGLQVILVGDFFQLPPVQRDDTPSLTSSTTPFAFTSPSWAAANPLVCYLDEQHRQEDRVFLQFLSAIRSGSAGETQVALLRTRYAKNPPEGITQLYSHNADVDRINDAELGKVEGKSVTFSMVSRGAPHIIESLKRGCLSPEILVLKEGARVMCTKNDVMGRFVNGTVGEVIGFEDGTGYPRIKTQGRTHVIEPDEWKLEDGGKVLGKISQVPLRLAWAITVHKSQGMSLDAAHMDLSGAFEYGQGYVALSRVRTLEGLTLSGLNPKALQVHPVVQSKDIFFRTHSKKVCEVFTAMPPEEVLTLHEAFVRTCGGGVSIEKKRVILKKSTFEMTRELVCQKKTLTDIAHLRGVTEGTIVSHVEELYEKGILSKKDIIYLVKGHSKEMTSAKKAWEHVGGERLTPVFELLKGKVSYELIRLARILK